MIEAAKLNTEFTQRYGSCVLASYGIVSNYFIGLPVVQSFEDYCRHFGEPFNSWQEAEEKYATHFDREWKRKKCCGYEVILDLHNNSQQTIFKQGRKIFSATFFFNSSSVLSDLEKQLINNESLLNITFDVGRDHHSITVFYNTGNFWSRDTRFRGIDIIKGLDKLGSLRDSVLYSKVLDTGRKEDSF